MSEPEPNDDAGVRRIAPAMPAGPAWYPVYLDAVEAARVAVPEAGRLLGLTAAALAPSFEELRDAGLVGGQARPITRSDIGPSDEAAIVQNQLATNAAQALARLPADVSLELGHLDFWDPASREFLDRLLRESRRCRVVIGAGKSGATLARLPETADPPAISPGGRQGRRGRAGPADDYLAISPHGLPSGVLADLGVGPSEIAEEIAGPAGAPVARLSPRRLREIAGTIDPARKARMHCAIYDAYGGAGWNYIRRGGHAQRCGDIGRMRETYVAYVAGLLRAGYDFVYDLLVAMAPLLEGDEHEAVRLCAARLAPRLLRRHGRAMATRHYLAALSHQRDLELRVSTLHELANLLANSRKPAELRASRRYYRRAFRDLAALPEGQGRDDLEIRLRNGVALLDYKAGDGAAALAHEKLAMEIAGRRAGTDEKYARWSEPLLRTNTSKLLLRLFRDGAGALDQLNRIPEGVDARTRFSKMQNLGRMHFELGDFSEARRCLGECLDDREHPGSYGEEEELFDLCLHAVASHRTGEAVPSAYLDRMAYLARVTKSRPAQQWVESLRGALQDRVA